MNTYSIIMSQFQRSRIDYFVLYAQLYIGYNAWYRQVTGITNEREAIRTLKTRFVIWSEYVSHRTLHSLDRYIDRIAELTNKHPLIHQNGSEGRVENRDDWKGLIQYWYQVRCELLHGSLSVDIPHHYEYVRLAYISLSLFMSELLDRMKLTLSPNELSRIGELQSLAQHHPLSDEQEAEQSRLLWRYIHAPERWQEDMTYIEKSPLYSSGEKRYNQAYTPWDNAVSCEK